VRFSQILATFTYQDRINYNRPVIVWSR